MSIRKLYFKWGSWKIHL